ncbi:DUF1573 domain-containing protein [bacterium]|nr:DUF1573 domain-containing protein [bacterium]
MPNDHPLHAWAIAIIAMIMLLAAGCGPSGPGKLSVDVPEEPIPVDSGSLELALANTGGTPVRILEVQSSCGCTIVDGDVPSVIEAGERASIPLRVSGSFYGAKDVRVTIRTDAERNPVQIASFRVAGKKLQPPYATQKSYVFRTEVERIDQEARTSFTIRTLEKKDSAHWLSALECSDSDATAIVKLEDERPFVDATVERRYQVSFSIPSMVSHPQGARFRLMPVLERPSAKPGPTVVVEVDVVHPLQAFPASVTLRAEREKRSVQQLLIAARHNRPVAVSVQSDLPAGLQVTPRQTGKGSSMNGQVFSIEVDWDALEPATDELDLTFLTDDTACPSVTVPVRLIRHRS